jgi:hypothetical protein
MAPDSTDNHVTIWRTYGKPAPPEKISQDPWDGDEHYLKRLARLRPGEHAEAGDLFYYAHALRYTEIQSSLLAYVLPFCLEAWRGDLLGIDSRYSGFVEEFYSVLADRRIFDEQLTLKQSATVSEYMRGTILEEIDDQRGLTYKGMGARPYRWVTALTTYGVLRPDIDRLWVEWWSLGTVGRAIAALQYISRLMYRENENPVFAPWTPNSGGGAPCLWEFGGHLYTHRWLEPNVRYLGGVLNVSRVREALLRAVEILAGQPGHEVALRMREDWPLVDGTVQARCTELPKLLGTTQEPGRLFQWST